MPTGGAVECGNDFYRLTTLANLFDCWLHARSNKGARLRIQRFAEDPLHYLTIIQQRLLDRQYTFGPYKTFTVREKKFRDVVDAPMKDRIVHWMLYQYLLPIWQPKFIHDTYGNLPGRGTHAAVRRLAQFARSANATWVLQLDISKYFYSINHVLLKERVLRYIGDHELRTLLVNLIDSFQTNDSYNHLFDESTLFRQTTAKGMPIGNLSSQLFANIFLNDFDHWIKETLRVRRYVRYVDDMVILCDSLEGLQTLCEQITAKLASDGLVIHPHKIRLAPTSTGIPFLGYVVWPQHISAGRYIRTRYHQRLRQHDSGTRDRTDALRSYQAMLNHTGSTRHKGMQ
ncbi:MAG: RNA-directed DNA polymerase (Reverse transcriptase) [Gallionella sp.]|nr:RNA-directed DNA polymerase (Reverse transcriptase) [Gallionella sp.]